MVVSFVAGYIAEILIRQIDMLQEFKSAVSRYDYADEEGILDIIKNMDDSFEMSMQRMEEEFIEELALGNVPIAKAKEIFTLMRQERKLMFEIMSIYQTELSAQRKRLLDGIHLLEDVERDFLKVA